MSSSRSWRPGRVAAWALFDFANSPYSTIMTTVGFPSFFLAAVAPGVSGPLLWGLLYGLSEVTAALLSPALGALSDARGQRRPFLFFATALCILGTISCVWIGEGDLVTAFLFFGLANLGFSLAQVFYNALLPEIAPPDRLDTVSGIGFATGYLGGLTGLLLVRPLYAGGTGDGNLSNVHLSFLLVAAIFTVFSLPLLFMREGGTKSQVERVGLRAAYLRVWDTLRSIRRYKSLFWYLLANFFFNDGVSTIILFAAPFAVKVLGMEMPEVVGLFILLNVVAIFGAFSLGWVADRIGSRRMLFILLAGWIALSVCLALVQTPMQFTVAAALAGLLLGPTQSVARGYLAHLAPAEMKGEFFGFFGMAGKFAALAGPLLFGAASAAFGTMRAGAVALIPLFALGIFCLSKVSEEGTAPDS